MTIYPYEMLYNKTIIENCNIEITDQCIFKCIHCDFPKKKKGVFLSFDDIKGIVAELKRLGTFRIVITGGEPFEHPDILKIIKFIHDESFMVRVITNGYFMTPEHCVELASLPRLEIMFSILGVEDKHDELTGVRGSFSKVIKTMKLLKNKRCKIGIQSSVIKDNFDNVEKLISLGEEFGVSTRLDPIIFNTLKENDVEKLRLDNVQLRHFYKTYTKMTNLATTVNKNHRQVRLNSCSCGIARTSVTIDCYKNVFPCGTLRIKMGNLNENSLESIWIDSPITLRFRNLSSSLRGKCVTCKHSTLCSRCLALAESEDGYESVPRECCRHIEAMLEG